MSTPATPSTVVDKNDASTRVDDVQTSDPQTRRRVAPLAPDERRAAIIEATIPLLEEHGTAINTKQIAQAAGVAEGTLFRVFPDKGSLLRAAVLSAADPRRAIEAMEAINPTDRLHVRLARAADILIRRIGNRGRIHSLAREIFLECGPNSEFGAALGANRERMISALADVMLPDRDVLRVPPQTAARLMMSIIVASHGHMFGESNLLNPEEIVTLLLDGLLDRSSERTKELSC